MAVQFFATSFNNTFQNPEGTDLNKWLDINFDDFEVELFDFQIGALTGDLPNPISGDYEIGASSGSVDFFLDFPSFDLGSFAVQYGADLSIDAPGSVSEGDLFTVTIGSEVKDGDKVAKGETIDVDVGSAGLNLDFQMDPSSVNMDGFLEIWGYTLVPFKRSITTPSVNVEDFVLFEYSSAEASVEVGEFELFAALPEAGEGSTDQKGTGAVNALSSVSLTALSENKIAGISTNLLELFDFGPLAFLDVLAEDEIEIPGHSWEFEYTLFGLPVELGLSVEQVMTYTPDLNTATVTLSSGEASGDVDVSKSMGSSFALSAGAGVGDGVDFFADLAMGGTLEVQYGLALTASLGVDALSFLFVNEDTNEQIGIPGLHEDLVNIKLGSIPIWTDAITLADDALKAQLQFAIGADDEPVVGDGLLHAYTDGGKTLDQIAADALADDPSLSFVPGSVSVVGDHASIGWFDSANVGSGALGGGIFLTSGNEMPPYSNTSSGFGASRGEPGDPRLDAIVSTVFEGDYQTNDATVFGFDVLVDNPAATSVTFDVVFGSEEFPEFVDSFVDIGAVFVNGKNYAYFNNDENRPLSVISDNLNGGYFLDNTGGAYSIEFDGLSNVLTISAPIKQGKNRIEIAVADTGDHILDSGIAVANIRTGEYTGGGTKLLVTPSGSNAGNNVLVSGDDEIDEFFDMGDGNDYVSAKKGNDILALGNGDDEGWGGDGDDQLDGGAGNDKLYGEYGFDWFVAANGEGDDLYDGGEGIDTVAFLSATKQIKVNLGEGWATGEEIGNDTLVSIEKVLSGAGSDILIGSDGDEWLDGGAGKDKVYGLDGDDTLGGGAGNDLLNGGAGYDIADFSDATGAVRVNLGIRRFQKTGEGKDKLVGIEGVASGDGNDRLIGNKLANDLSGGDGNDLLLGKGGSDILDGGLGNDRLVGGPGSDTARFSSGNDITVKLSTGRKQDTGEGIDRLRSIENAETGDGNDVLLGSKARNTLDAGGGDDILKGYGGKDRLIGGEGDDELYGGGGADVFVFNEDFGHDTVMDFAVSQKGEVLDFTGTVTSLDELTIEAANDGADTLITQIATGATVLLVGVALGNFNAADDILY